MRAGDILVTVNGEYVVVEQISHELLEEPEVTYNFEVEGFHTYYVGNTSVLVHNVCGEYGTYEKAPYHNGGNAVKSAAPKNGQAALDNSIQVSQNSPRRIGISENEFVVLDQTTPGTYHGHVRTWEELTQTMKNVLIKAGKVTSKGKIIK